MLEIVFLKDPKIKHFLVGLKTFIVVLKLLEYMVVLRTLLRAGRK